MNNQFSVEYQLTGSKLSLYEVACDVEELGLNCQDLRDLVDENTPNINHGNHAKMGFDDARHSLHNWIEKLDYTLEYKEGIPIAGNFLYNQRKIVLNESFNSVKNQGLPKEYQNQIISVLAKQFGIVLYFEKYKQFEKCKITDIDSVIKRYDFWHKMNDHDLLMANKSAEVVGALAVAPQEEFKSAFWDILDQTPKYLGKPPYQGDIGFQVQLTEPDAKKIISKLHLKFRIPDLWLLRRLSCSGLTCIQIPA